MASENEQSDNARDVFHCAVLNICICMHAECRPCQKWFMISSNRHFFSANENILRGVFWLQSVQCLLPPTGLSAALYTDNGCPGPGWLQARLAELANIYTQIQFPAKLDSRMCSRHEYPRLEMRLFKFPLAPSLSAGMETQGLKTLVRNWGLENDPRLFREFVVILILVSHLWCSVLTGPNILTSAPL